MAQRLADELGGSGHQAGMLGPREASQSERSREKSFREYTLFPHTFPKAVVLSEPARGEPSGLSIDFHCPTCDQSFLHSFEAAPGTRGAARSNQATVGVRDLKRNCIRELIRVATELDGPRKPVCLYPGSGGAEDEGLGHRAVSIAACVPPNTQVRSE